MGVNKVQLANGETLVDMSDATITEDTVLEGYKGYGANGELIVGTASALNFRIVGGTAQPANPTENTVWVNTDQAITKWAFAAKNLFLKNRDVDRLDGLTLGAGYLSSSGTVTSQTAANPEVYTQEYVPVEYGKEYVYNYEVSATKSMWLAIVEYTGSYTFSKRTVLVNSVSGTIQSGVYTPSSESVTAVRLTWRTFTGVDCSVELIENVIYTEESDYGAVWFAAASQSSVAFNVLKQNNIMVYPNAAWQCVDGAWIQQDAATYLDGQWKSWIEYLIENGIAKATFTTQRVSYTEAEGGMTIAGTASGYHEIFTEVDLTGRTTLGVDGTFSGISGSGTYLRLAVWETDVSEVIYSSNIAYKQITASGVTEVDVSGLSGTYYVGICTMGENTHTIKDLYLV